jgi:xanthine dehydrogenase accessory factor
MKEIFPTIEQWIAQTKSFAIATVTNTWGSSPRPVGSTMIVSTDMEMAGSVSGGCVEGAVLKAAKDLIEQGGGKRLAFGVTDEEAWQVGLTCGGSIQVYLDSFNVKDDQTEENALWQRLQSCLKNNEPCILVTKLVDGENQHLLVFPDGTYLGKAPQAELLEQALDAYKERKNQVIEIEDQQYFAHIFPRQSQMLIIGAAHITADLVQLAKLYDFETIVIDPRGVFTNKTQFKIPPDQLHEKYPEEVLGDFNLDTYTFAVILSHDPKIDDNALNLLLRSDVAYIGALGSRKTQAKRVARLTEAGYSKAEIARIHAPIGVDINAKKPREIALSIIGEIIKVQNQFF